MDKQKLKSLLILPKTTIKQAMQKLNETGEKILFVVDEHNRLMGTVTDGDIRRSIINGLGFGDAIEDVMYKDFFSLNINTPEIEDQAKKIMFENKIEQIPILNERGEIIDIILWTEVLEEKVQPKSKRLYNNHVVIMAGGKGTRLDPFTKILPKPLIPIGNKPVIEIIMERFYQCGFHKFIYTLNYKKEYMKLFLKENSFSYDIDWIEEDEYLGTAGGLSLLADRINNTFFVANCDSVLDVDFEQVMKWHKEYDATMTIIGCHSEVKIPFGVLELSNGKLEKILEKPVHDVIINTGVYVMEPHVISYIPEDRYMDMNELIEVVIEKEKVSIYPIYKGWFDIGQWDEYKNTIEKLQGIEGK